MFLWSAALNKYCTLYSATLRDSSEALCYFIGWCTIVVDTTQAYALDRPSDDEDDDEEDMDLNDLNPNQAAQGNAGGLITSDFFQRAMMMAAGGALNPPAAPVVNQVWTKLTYA